MLTILDLFSGIGGFSLGLERTGGFRTIAFCEREPYAVKVLGKHWPGVQVYGDVRQLDADQLARDGLPRPDVVCGGFPCQDISLAGKGAGLDGERSGLWFEMLRIISETRPRFVIAENVAALRSRGLDTCLRGLASVGYDAEWHCIPAAAVGAPHRRDRVWIVAYPGRVGSSIGGEAGYLVGSSGAREGDREERQWHGDAADDRSSVVADAACELPHGSRPVTGQAGWHQPANGGADVRHPHSAGLAQREGERGHPRPKLTTVERTDWWTIEPDVGRGLDGLPRWMDRHVGRGLSHAESARRVEVLRGLWSAYVAKALARAAGGLDRVSQAQVLFYFVREYEAGSDEARLLVAGQETSEGFLRSLRQHAVARSAPRRPGQGQKPAREHTDAMQLVSQFLACDSEATWAGDCWEDAVPRVADGVPARVDRLRCLGNSIVPQIAEMIGRAILADTERNDT